MNFSCKLIKWSHLVFVYDIVLLISCLFSLCYFLLWRLLFLVSTHTHTRPDWIYLSLPFHLYRVEARLNLERHKANNHLCKDFNLHAYSTEKSFYDLLMFKFTVHFIYHILNLVGLWRLYLETNNCWSTYTRVVLLKEWNSNVMKI